jgi:hypothetical protein
MLGRVMTVTLLAANAAVPASPVETWECRAGFSSGPVLVTATVESGRTKGKIAVAGVTKTTRFEVAGFDRRWDFGQQPDGTFRYSFIIKPDGNATYFDFGNAKSAKPSDYMTCSQVDAAKAPKNSDAPNQSG